MTTIRSYTVAIEMEAGAGIEPAQSMVLQTMSFPLRHPAVYEVVSTLLSPKNNRYQ